jgi:hypothetical protein
MKRRMLDPRRALVMMKRAACKRTGIPFDLNLMLSIPCPESCPALGTPISFQMGAGHRDTANTASYDQIIPGKGYVVGNVVVVSKRANAMKSNATPHELLRFAEWIISEYGYLLNTATP